MGRNKLIDEEEELDNEVEETQEETIDISMLRACALYGPVEEKRCLNIIHNFLLFKEAGKTMEPEDPENPESNLIEVYRNEPVDFYISTWGGNLTDMFSVYDFMRYINDYFDIHTFGIGKVMSAGVLLLAAGKKGQRRIGANCRLMIHNIRSSHDGDYNFMENEFKEMKWEKDQYIKALMNETSMSKRNLNRLFNRKTNYYFGAEEAVKLGIADIIV